MLFLEEETNLRPQSVSQISAAIQQKLEDSFCYVKVQGEVSNFIKHTSGHLYFSLKDEQSVINVIMWKDKAKALGFKIENGMELVVSGKVSGYAKSSRYNINASGALLAGRGEILKLIAQREQKLAKLGFFDKSQHLKFANFPQKIGLITSQTGAVLVDIVNTIKERYGVQILLYNAIMQGISCPSSILAGLKTFEKHKIDALIIARGGGSAEDLFYFNDEDLIKAVHKFCIKISPVISAIGHGSDTTLLDKAATHHTVTPTAAAQFAVPSGRDLSAAIETQFSLVRQKMLQNIERKKAAVKSIALNTNPLAKTSHKLTSVINNIERQMQGKMQARKDIINAAFAKCQKGIAKQSERLAWQIRSINNINLQELAARQINNRYKILDKLTNATNFISLIAKSGFCLVYNQGGEKITSPAQTHPNQPLTIKTPNGLILTQTLAKVSAKFSAKVDEK